MKPRVLLIEDDPTMLSLLNILLEIEGYEILPLQDDSEDGIIANISNTKPNLILMDVNLRKANGLDVLRRLRSEEDLHDIRIMMSSGMDYRIECKKAGADYFLQKPYMPDELVEAIRKTINQDSRPGN